MMSDLNIFPGKISGLVSLLLSLLQFTLVIKLRNFGFESHWNTSIFLDKKDIASGWNISHWKMSDFVSFSLFGITLVIKLRNFDFESIKIL